MDGPTYFVIDAATGNKYGPADLNTLNQWILEGRVLPGTMLEDTTSGAQIRADRVPGVHFVDHAATAQAGAVPAMSPPAATTPGAQLGWRGYPLGVHFEFLMDSVTLAKKTWSQWVPVVVILVVANLIGNLPSSMQSGWRLLPSTNSLEAALGIGSIFSLLWSLLVIQVLNVGSLCFALDIVDGKSPDVSRVFSPFKSWLPVVVSHTLYIIMVTVGVFFCILPGFYLWEGLITGLSRSLSRMRAPWMPTTLSGSGKVRSHGRWRVSLSSATSLPRLELLPAWWDCFSRYPSLA